MRGVITPPLKGLLKKPHQSCSTRRGGPVCPPNRSDENTENGSTHSQTYMSDPYAESQNREAVFLPPYFVGRKNTQEL